MRKLIVSINITLDGYCSGPSGQMDWHFDCWTHEMGYQLCVELAKADTILLGRITYDAMAAYWPAKLNQGDCHEESFAFANMMNYYRKILASRTRASAGWYNTEIVAGNLFSRLRNLKKEKGKNIIVYGSRQLVIELMRKNLVDEYQFWLHPVMLGSGHSLFQTDLPASAFCLTEQQRFSTGVLMLRYSSIRA